MLDIPEKMYGKGPKNNPCPYKSYDTSGSHAYGDAEIRMLNPEPKEPKFSQLVIKVVNKKGK